LKKLLLVTAAAAAAVALFAALTIPPRRLTLNPIRDGTVAGIVHVHTNRSDGSRGPDDIAAAAARAGLKFVVFTDHGDGTRKPDPPQYRSGVLCLDGVEISTTGGHYIALDMPAAPYPLAGEPRDVVEDVRRLGGFGIAAHPDSPKLELRWREWTAPFDGIELLNPDTSWRLLAQEPGWRPKRRLLTALVDYPFRPTETIASLVQPSGSLYSWQALTARRRVVALGGVDAHANLQWRSDPGDARVGIPLPGYEASFRVMSVHVALERELTGSAPADAAILMRAIRAGHLYTAVDGVASPPAFEFSATNDRGTAHEGDELAAGSPVMLRVRSNAPPEFTTIVHSGMQTLASVRDPQDLTVHAPDKPAVYWVEIVSTGRPNPITWLRSNPIYVRGPEPLTREAARPAATVSQTIFDGSSIEQWRTEHDSTSLSAIDRAAYFGGYEIRFRYGLSGGSPAGQVAALVFDTPKGIDANRLTLTGRAERPMRVSVQLRGGNGDAAGERWQRSVYLDPMDQEKIVYFDDLMPVGATHTFRPALADIRSILFAVDTTNAKLGSSGRIWIKKAELQR
jgi:hypothetical protein